MRRWWIEAGDLSTFEARGRGRYEVCRECGAFADIGDDQCPVCDVLFDGTNSEVLTLLDLPNVKLSRHQRITCNEEERIRKGYDVQVTYRLALAESGARTAEADLIVGDRPLFRLTYAPAATILYINRGWRGRPQGFVVDLASGELFTDGEVERQSKQNQRPGPPNQTQQWQRLARHFIQRTRKDIESQWEGARCFPKREPVEETYTLSPAYRRLFDAVYGFCTEIVESGRSLQAHRRRMRWWSALALLRCVMSSRRAAKVALERCRKGEALPYGEEDGDTSYVYEPDERLPTDELPTPLLDKAEAELTDPEKRRLRELERMAAGISENEDHKLKECVRLVQKLLRDGFNPVVWCYYVETAEYAAEKLRQALSDGNPAAPVLCITGRMGEEERR